MVLITLTPGPSRGGPLMVGDLWRLSAVDGTFYYLAAATPAGVRLIRVDGSSYWSDRNAEPEDEANAKWTNLGKVTVGVDQ